jgi:D-xylose 1-dehydrogenase (NADP+, D-xylono-1,5-lactone-forming)
MNKVRWGILGTENSKFNAIVSAMQKARNSDLIAIASPEADIGNVATSLNIPRHYQTYDELIAASDIDAIYNFLPPYQHPEWGIKVAQAGKSMLCDKLLAPHHFRRAEQEMHEAFREHSVELAVALPYRFHPQQQRVKQLIDEGAIGNIHIIRASLTYTLPPEQRETDYRMHKETDGGSLRDVGCYCIDLMRWLTGDEPDMMDGIPQWSSNEAARRYDRNIVDLNLVAMIKFPSGILGHFDCGFASAPEDSYEIRGESGRILVESGFFSKPDEEKTIHLWRGDRHEAVVIPPANDILLMIEDFADALNTGRHPTVNLEDLRLTARVISGIYNHYYNYTQAEVLRAAEVDWRFKIRVEQEGKELGTGVGFLPNGTFVVVEGGKRYVGQEVDVVVTDALLSSAGYMIFARVDDDED